MTEAEFWLLIDTMGGVADSGTTVGLTERLSQETPGRIFDFQDHLSAALYAIDSPAGADVTIDGEEGETMGDDGYLYVRCSVVAAGRQAWEQVAQDPASIRPTWDAFDGEYLLYVAMQAYEQSTGNAWTHVSPVSYETGSNTANWG